MSFRRDQTEKRSGSRRAPLLLAALTLVIAALIGGIHWFRVELSDGPLAFDFGVVNMVTVLTGFVVGVSWLVWICFFSGWNRLWSLGIPVLVVLAIVAGLICYRPIFSGGMATGRWEARFWKSRPEIRVATGDEVQLSRADPLAFTGFLGSERTGVVRAFRGDLARIGEARQLWKVPIGAGWSGFVASDGFAWTLQQDGGDEMVVCLELARGNLIWEYRHPRRHDDPLGGVGPRSTPLLDGNRVYAQGANGLLVCLNAATGEKIWEQDIGKLAGTSLRAGTTTRGVPYQQEEFNVVWGRAASPLVVADTVVVPCGGPRGGPHDSLIAFDRETGVERWRGGSDPIGYSSPALLPISGDEQIVIVNEASMTGHDPATGEVLWSFPWPGTSDAAANTSQPALIGDSRVLVSKGYGMGAELVQVSRESDGQWSASSIWKNPRSMKTKLTSPVVRGGFAYGLSDGILECIDVSTGERVWKKGRYEHGQVLLAGNYLLVHAESGFLVAGEATPDGWTELAGVTTIDGVCWNTICLYDDKILVRSDLEAACFQLPVRGSGAVVPPATDDEPGSAGDDSGERP